MRDHIEKWKFTSPGRDRKNGPFSLKIFSRSIISSMLVPNPTKRFCLSVTSLRAGLDKFAGKSKRQYGKSKWINMNTYIFYDFWKSESKLARYTHYCWHDGVDSLTESDGGDSIILGWQGVATVFNIRQILIYLLNFLLYFLQLQMHGKNFTQNWSSWFTMCSQKVILVLVWEPA